MKKIRILASLLIFSAFAFSVLAGPHGGMKKMMKHHFKMMDKNGDKKISKAEWDAHHAEMFKNIDKNGDGTLVKAEFKAHFKAMHDKHKKGHGDD